MSTKANRPKTGTGASYIELSPVEGADNFHIVDHIDLQTEANIWLELGGRFTSILDTINIVSNGRRNIRCACTNHTRNAPPPKREYRRNGKCKRICGRGALRWNSNWTGINIDGISTLAR